MNSFAMIFGHCVWIPPSPKAALAALSLFYGIGINGGADIDKYEYAVASEYVSTGETKVQAQKQIDWLNACFASYEVPPQNMNHPEDAQGGRAPLPPAQPIDRVPLLQSRKGGGR
jgi:hypothetical protein